MAAEGGGVMDADDGPTLYRCHFFAPAVEAARLTGRRGAWRTYRRPDGTEFRESGNRGWCPSAEVAVRDAIRQLTDWLDECPDFLKVFAHWGGAAGDHIEWAKDRLRALCRLYAALPP